MTPSAPARSGSLHRPLARRPVRTGAAAWGLAAAALLGGVAHAAQGPPGEGALTGWHPSVRLDAGAFLDLGGASPIGLERVGTPTVDPLRDVAPLRLVGAWFDVSGAAGIRPPLGRLEPPAGEERSRVERGKKASPGLLGIGAEYTVWFGGGGGAAGPATWAYLRVLDVDLDAVVAEVAVATPGAAWLVRDPLRVDVDVRDGRVDLHWAPGDASRAGEGAEVSVALPRSYEIRRRAIGATEFESIAVVRGHAFTDREPSADGDAAFEYSVVRVDAEGQPAPGVMGSTVSVVAEAEPPEAVLTVGPGSGVDLLRGSLATTSDDLHVTVGRAAPGSVALVPQAATRFASETSSKSGRTDPSWWLPPSSHKSFLAGRTLVLQEGVEAVFLLPNGLMGRLEVEDLGQERWRIHRRLALGGTRLLPRAPDAPPRTEPGPDGELLLVVEPLQKTSGVDPSSIAAVFEREVPFGSEDWLGFGVSDSADARFDARELFERGPGGADRGVAPIARVRVRYRTPLGDLSPPGPPAEVLAFIGNEVAAQQALDVALAELDTADFQRRVEARAVLRLFGEAARPGLEAIALEGVGPRPEAAREVLAAIGEGKASAARLATELIAFAVDDVRGEARSAAEAEVWLGPCPDGLVHPRLARRMHALLVLVDQAERGALSGGLRNLRDDAARARAWVRAVAALDRDDGVRALASFLIEVGIRPSAAALEPARAAWLESPAARQVDESLALRWSELPAAGSELAWAIEVRPELSDLDLGEPLARLLATLREPHRFAGPDGIWGPGGADLSEAAEARFFDYDAGTAGLVLELVERARRPSATPAQREAWIAAATALLPGEARRLEAWREVSDRRVASPASASASVAVRAAERGTVVLERADLPTLEAALALLEERADGAGVDLRLPAGTYGSRDSTALFLEVPASRVRILPDDPDGEVILHAGIRVTGRTDVVLEGLTVRNGTGPAITALDGAHVVAVQSRLEGAGTVVHAQGASLEFVECEVLGVDPAQPPSIAIRLILGSRLHARASLFDAGTIFISSDGEAWLDRCVLDAGLRTLVQSQEGGLLVVRESLLRGDAMGLFRVTEGVLAATVIDVPRDPLGQVQRGRGSDGLRVSPRLFRLVQPGQSVPAWMRLDREPLGGR